MMRTVIVTGPSFCGSTLTCSLLSNVPGVIGMGELHWAIDKRASCVRCRDSCPIVPKVQRPGLKDSNLYQRTRTAIEREYPKALAMVTTDKLPSFICRFAMPKTTDGLLLLRRPEGFVASWRRKPERYDPYKVLPRIYNNMLRWAPGFYRKLVVADFNEIVINPREMIEKVCSRLDLPSPPDQLIHPSPTQWHNVGGNWESLSHPVRGQGIHEADQWQEELSAEDRRRIDKELLPLWYRTKKLCI